VCVSVAEQPSEVLSMAVFAACQPHTDDLLGEDHIVVVRVGIEELQDQLTSRLDLLGGPAAAGVPAVRVAKGAARELLHDCRDL